MQVLHGYWRLGRYGVGGVQMLRQNAGVRLDVGQFNDFERF